VGHAGQRGIGRDLERHAQRHQISRDGPDLVPATTRPAGQSASTPQDRALVASAIIPAHRSPARVREGPPRGHDIELDDGADADTGRRDPLGDEDRDAGGGDSERGSDASTSDVIDICACDIARASDVDNACASEHIGIDDCARDDCTDDDDKHIGARAGEHIGIDDCASDVDIDDCASEHIGIDCACDVDDKYIVGDCTWDVDDKHIGIDASTRDVIDKHGISDCGCGDLSKHVAIDDWACDVIGKHVRIGGCACVNKHNAIDN
jgi:hypothetical protein